MMIKSMTGYGGAKGSAEGLELSIELKSVNNRYLDTNIRMPRSFIFAEESLKARIQSHISRGKVDVYVTVDSSQADNILVSVNQALAAGYVRALTQIAHENGLEAGATAAVIARFPEVLSVEKKEADKEVISEALGSVLEQALTEYDAMRAREGDKLRLDILSRLETIEALVTFVEERSPRTVAEYRAKLEARMREVLENTAIEEARLLTEAALFADKVAVDEETVRLRSHIAQMREMLEAGSPVGRKLDFLIQEFNREANTIGSKGNDTEIARCVVDLKAEIEKIREQVQNIE